MKDKILEEFKSKKETLDYFKDRAVNLLVDLLRENKIIIHQISGRTKDLESLDKKIDRKSGKYKNLSDITDLVGIRIITYLESDVDLISQLILDEFKEDKPNSTDKRILKSDQFGYKSLHIVCSLNDARSDLKEYISYKDIKCEVQIRSILQHAWAEIEHDLGYKGKSAIPEEYVRDFNRLAALLETADKEFDRLKNELNMYERNISQLIKEKPDKIELNQASLKSLISTNEIFEIARKIIAKNLSSKFFEDTDLSDLISRFKFFKIETIKELEDDLEKNKIIFLSFVNEFTKNLAKYDKLPMSITVFYYQHFLASIDENAQKVLDYFKCEMPQIAGGIGSAERFVEVYREAKKNSNDLIL